MTETSKMAEMTNDELDHTIRAVYRSLSMTEGLRDRMLQALVELKVRRMDKHDVATIKKFAETPCGFCGHRPSDVIAAVPKQQGNSTPPLPQKQPSDLCGSCGQRRDDHHVRHPFKEEGAVYGRPFVPVPAADAGDIPLSDFTWIVNNLGELGIKVRDTFVFFHDGRTISYTTDVNPSPLTLRWRPIQLNEYGIIRPCNTDWEGDYYVHGEGWQDLPLKEF